MAKQTYLDFEQPLAELQTKIDELTELHHGVDQLDVSDEVKKAHQKARRPQQVDLRQAHAMADRAGSAHPQRPYTLDYANGLFTDFVELHGDRAYADDAAIVGGLAKFRRPELHGDRPPKGRDTKGERCCATGACPPRGLPQTLRLMKLADKFAPADLHLRRPRAPIPASALRSAASPRRSAAICSRWRRSSRQSSSPSLAKVAPAARLAVAVGDVTAMLQYATIR